ncbi:Hpt domain-containing protein [Erysipelotrichaceae bacterium AF15-26LB]|nr:Hpt domain-containing protein [Erysipelotrichaceae bacterium AF19-24AC]RJV91166.1 Hpt domain-containing protein [Erysipelotrichaceae bacterium AF15-26LB]
MGIMTVQECYLRMGADYAAALRLMKSDERILKFLTMLLRDENYTALCAAMDKRDCEQAFRAAHTIKGISLNLCLKELAAAASLLTDALRPGVWTQDVPELFEQVKKQYDVMLAAVHEAVQANGGTADETAK